MDFHKSTAIYVLFLSAICFLGVNCEAIASEESRAPIYLGNVVNKQFFLIEGLVPWREAMMACRSVGMNMVTMNNQAEYDFVHHQLTDEDRGPFWLGAREIGQKSMYGWAEWPYRPDPEDPATHIGDFIGFYNWLEQGSMALQMHKNTGWTVYGSHSLIASAKALCQVG